MGNFMKMMMLAQGTRVEPERRYNGMVDYPRENRRNEMPMEKNRKNTYSADEEYYSARPRNYEMPDRQSNEQRREEPEMRRRRDKRGRYMEEEDMRYSGLYDGAEIGFGNERRYNSLEAGKRQSAQIGGSLWMEPEMEDEKGFGKAEMHKWVEHMKDDKDKPLKPWPEEDIKPLARRYGYPINGEEFETFYAAIHMMKSDYCGVAEEFDVDTPAFYAALADAWLNDPDSELKDKKKLEAYYKHVIKGKK